MNARSKEVFADEGGAALVGRSVFDCHPERTRITTVDLSHRRQPNHNTIRKRGQKKIIHQVPCLNNGVFAELVDISIPIPDDLPHFDRG